MNDILLISILLAAGLCVVLFVLLRKLTAAPKVDVEPESTARLLADRYQPMGRLLDSVDQAFLEVHPAATAKLVREFRARRRRIFRAYLRCMVRDFDRISSAIRWLMATSREDHPELAAAVLKQSVVFRFALLAVECRLVLHAWGIGTVDIRGITGVFEAMRLELRQLMPVPDAAF